MASVNQSRYIPPPPPKPSKRQLIWVLIVFIKAFIVTLIILNMITIFASIVDYFKYQSQFVKDGGWAMLYILIVWSAVMLVIWFSFVKHLKPKDMFK